MQILKLIFLLAVIHLFLVIITFLFFGLGLEGERNIGHALLWILLQPGASFPGPWLLILTINSFLWGLCSAVLFKALCRILTKC